VSYLCNNRGCNEKKKKNSTIKPLPRGGGGQWKKNERKIAKKIEDSTIKPLSTIFVPCMKMQGGTTTLLIKPLSTNTSIKPLSTRPIFVP